jgi:prepilin-type N-terminal cleavage/methylation domain-containing protein
MKNSMRPYPTYPDIQLPQAAVRQHERAFTLVEIMVAIVVLSIGLLASASMQFSAIRMNSFANGMTTATNLAQSRLEELMARQYTQAFTDPVLIGDGAATGTQESFTDCNGNGLWDFGESYADSNGNNVWDAAHVDPNPPSGYTITWSVTDNRPVSHAKFIRMYVTQHDKMKTVLLSCIKPRE